MELAGDISGGLWRRLSVLSVKITSCKDCTDRTIGCHGRCERYKADKAAFAADAKAKRDFLRADDDYIEFKAITAEATKKRKGRFK